MTKLQNNEIVYTVICEKMSVIIEVRQTIIAPFEFKKLDRIVI